MEINNQNLSFQGRLYAHLGRHISKPIHCCKHGDKKFIRFLNEIASNNQDSFKARITDNLCKHLEIETKEAPHLTLLEKILFIVSPIQNKALKMREEGKIDYLTYKISEDEYQKVKRAAPKKLRNELKIFEENMRQKFSGEELTALNKIIY